MNRNCLFLVLPPLLSTIILPGSVPKDQLGGVKPPILRLTIENDQGEFSGTGTIFRKTVEGSEIRFCILTADHVVEIKGKLTLGFGDIGGAETFIVEPKAKTIHGSQNFNNADLAVVQVTIDSTQVDTHQWSFLSGILPVSIASPPNAEREWQFDNKLMYDVSLWGYGRTGDPLRQDGYRSLFARPEHENGTLRWFRQRIIAHANEFEFTDSGTGKMYKSNIMVYTFDRNRDAGAIANEGYPLTGDSGGPVFYGDFVVGVQSFATNEEVKNEKGEVIGIDVLYGKPGGPVRLTAGYIQKINKLCPE
ncbi:MAG TPA: hypothetical protein VNK96_02730 [Fimbriimonadales bacterium]|nr:hypothetical protein [Fimbriimonadales bacterium]